MSQNAHPKTLILIPALNEEDSIAHVIASIRQHVPYADIAVINDGSTDQTGTIAEGCGAVVLHMPFNVGIGAGMQGGFMYAARGGYAVAVQTDGDGQHPANEIPHLIEALKREQADLVIGSRYIENRGYVTPGARRAGIILLARLLSRITGQMITDPTSGFRASNRRTIEFCARDYPFDYPEPEAIALLHRAGLKVCEIPVTMKPRYGGRSSITPLRSIYYMIKVNLAILIGLLRKPGKVSAAE